MECTKNSVCQKLSGCLSDEVGIGQVLIKYLIKLICISHYTHRYAAVTLSHLKLSRQEIKEENTLPDNKI